MVVIYRFINKTSHNLQQTSSWYIQLTNRTSDISLIPGEGVLIIPVGNSNT